MLKMPVYVLYVPSKDGDWMVHNRLNSLCLRAQTEGWSPISLVTVPIFEERYKDSGVSVEEVFGFIHKDFFGGKIDSVLSLWIDGSGSSVYARDFICYAFEKDLEVRCFSPKNSLMERYMRPFFGEQLRRISSSRSLSWF